MKIKMHVANRIAPDGTPRFAASHLGLLCLPMSHKKDTRLIWLSAVIFKRFEWFSLIDLQYYTYNVRGIVQA